MAPGSRTSPIRRVRAFVSRETTGGILILLGAIVGLVLANSPAQQWFEDLSATQVGPASVATLPVHLDLTVGQWAQDGLLALFFFTVGVELAQEFRVGSLRRPRHAAVPILAAVGGVAVPAAVFLAVDAAWAGGRNAHGWAIPTATDIAFAVAVLVIFGRGLPAALRSFLLTLAVVDDLIGIVLIAVVYSGRAGIDWAALAGAVAAVALFAWLVRRPRMRPWLAAPVAVVAWALTHASGVHATIAGAALGLVVPALPRAGEALSRATQMDLAVRPLSNGLALPVFAVFAAGVPLRLGGAAGGAAAGPGLLTDPLVWAIVIALVVGKPLGVLMTTAAVTSWTGLRLPDSVGRRDLVPVGFLCGIGFTVSMLIAGLSFDDAALVDDARAAILIGSVISAALGAGMLRRAARRARSADMNEDGAPDLDRRVIR